MWKIQSCKVCEFNFVYFCITCGKALPHFDTKVYKKYKSKYKSIQNSQTSRDCIFHILRYFATKLHNSIKLMMLFPAVLMNFPNSKVCPIGKWHSTTKNILKTAYLLHFVPLRRDIRWDKNSHMNIEIIRSIQVSFPSNRTRMNMP